MQPSAMAIMVVAVVGRFVWGVPAAVLWHGASWPYTRGNATCCGNWTPTSWNPQQMAEHRGIGLVISSFKMSTAVYWFILIPFRNILWTGSQLSWHLAKFTNYILDAGGGEIIIVGWYIFKPKCVSFESDESWECAQGGGRRVTLCYMSADIKVCCCR